MRNKRTRKGPPPSRGKPGRVIETVGRRVRVSDVDGERVCYLSGLRAVIGDRVMWEEAPGTGGKLVRVLERETTLERRDSQGRVRVLAANLRGIVVVASCRRPDFNAALIDRYLVAASFLGLEAAICLNKSDLGISEEVQAELDIRRDLGYPVLSVNTKTGADALQPLRTFLAEASGQGQGPFCLVGLSGVGKTSLVAGLLPETDVGPVGEVSEYWDQGTHTTTHSRLFELPSGGEICDSPGIRTFSPAGLTPRDVREHFPGVRDVHCHFRDCLCRPGEKGCASDAEVSSSLLVAYRRLLEYVSSAH